MKSVLPLVSAVALSMLLNPVRMPAQHVFSATYDDDRQVRLQGPVTRIEWVNPRAYLFIDVRDSAGTIANWAVEFGNPLDLEQDGWKRSTLRIGDMVTVEAVPARGIGRQAYRKVRGARSHRQAGIRGLEHTPGATSSGRDAALA